MDPDGGQLRHSGHLRLAGACTIVGWVVLSAGAVAALAYVGEDLPLLAMAAAAWALPLGLLFLVLGANLRLSVRIAANTEVLGRLAELLEQKNATEQG